MVCMWLVATGSDAAITITSPIRTLSSTNNKGASQVMEIVDFGNINVSTRVDWEEYWGRPADDAGSLTGKYHSLATQDSTVGFSEITARGSVTGTGSFYYYGGVPLIQQSSSYFEVAFTLDAPTLVVLSGTLDLSVDSGGTNLDMPYARVTLSAQAGEIFSQELSADNGSDQHQQIYQTFDSLEAGRYTLVASAVTHGYYDNYHGLGGIGGFGYASYDVTLVPEPSLLLLAAAGGMLILSRRARCRECYG